VAETVSLKVFSEPFTKMTADAERTSDKVTRYALRQVGREVAKAARKEAPKYSGQSPPPPGRTKGYVDHRAVAEAGNLRKSIKNRKRMDHVGGYFYLSVGPAGNKKQGTTTVRYANVSRGNTAESIAEAHKAGGASGQRGKNSSAGSLRGVLLYRAKIVEMAHYMAKGYAHGEAEAFKIFEEAVAKGFTKYK